MPTPPDVLRRRGCADLERAARAPDHRRTDKSGVELPETEKRMSATIEPSPRQWWRLNSDKQNNTTSRPTHRVLPRRAGSGIDSEGSSHHRVGTSTAGHKYVSPEHTASTCTQADHTASPSTGSRGSSLRRPGSHPSGSWSLFPRRIEPTRAQAAEDSIRRTETLPSLRHPIAMVDENVG